MRILLVGGLGFIGKRFIRKFSETYDITIFATPNDSSNVKEILNTTNISVEEGFVESADLVEVITRKKPDVVIHLAALTGLKKCQNDPEKAFRVNVYGTFNVIEACKMTNSKLIFMSSREVYGETINEESIEEDLLYPNNIYGTTKMLAELLIKQADRQNKLDYTILRLTNVYGPEGDQYGAQVIIKNAIKNKKIQILGGSQKLNYIYVDDVIDIIDLVISNKNSSRQVFNVGSNDNLSVEEFAIKVSNIVGGKIDFEYHPMRETETSNFKPSLKKANQLLGFKNKTPLEIGLKKTVEWYSK